MSDKFELGVKSVDIVRPIAFIINRLILSNRTRSAYKNLKVTYNH
jgi:hypothetical protein